MKKKILIVSILLLAVVILSGCSSTEISQTNSLVGENEANISFPTTKADVGGMIKSIVGNQVEIAIIDMPERDGDQSNKDNTGDEANLTTAFGGGTDMSRGMGGGGGEGNDRDSMATEMMVNSKESVSVIVPVGILMTKIVEGEEQSVIFSDLEVGTMLSVWLDESVIDRKVAKFLSIRLSR